MDKDEGPSDAFKEQGNAAFQLGDFNKAIEHYTMGIDQDPTNAVLFSNRSAAYLKQDMYDRAKLDAQMCIQLDPEWSKGWWRKGTAQIENQEYKEALATFKEGLKRCPGDHNLTTGLDRANNFISVIDSVVGPGEVEFDLDSKPRRRRSSDNDNHDASIGILPNGSIATDEMNGENSGPASAEVTNSGLNEKRTKPENEARNTGEADKSALEDEPDNKSKTVDPWPGTPEEEIERIKNAPNHYAVLHISTDASSQPQMKKNYYTLARMLHPDRCQLEDAGDAMTSISQAYDTLSNVLKKTLYDQFLSQTGGDGNHPNQTYQEWESRQQPVEIPKWLRFLLGIRGCGYCLALILAIIFLPLFVLILIIYVVLAILCLPVSLFFRVFFPEKYARMKEREAKEAAKVEEEAQDRMFAHV